VAIVAWLGEEKGRECVKRLLGLLCVVLIFGMVQIANAVSYSAGSWIYKDGETFSFDVSPVLDSHGPGTFVIEACGDYSIGDSSWEYLNWNIDGLISGSGEAPDNADAYTIHWPDTNDVGWIKTITIADAVLANITSDSQFNVTIENSAGVNNRTTWDRVGWTLTYSEIASAPEPATWLILLFGLVGMMGVKRKFS